MKVDPRSACVNHAEVRRWAVVHDAIAGCAMALSGYSAWAVRFHDWTSMRAWPRAEVAAARPATAHAA